MKKTIILNIDQIIVNGLNIFRLSVRGQAHHFIFARIDFKARVIGKGRVKKPQGVGKMDFVVIIAPLTAPFRTRHPESTATAGRYRGSGSGTGCTWW